MNEKSFSSCGTACLNLLILNNSDCLVQCIILLWVSGKKAKMIKLQMKQVKYMFYFSFFFYQIFSYKSVSNWHQSLKSDLKPPHIHFQRKKYHPSSPAIIRMQYLTGFSKQNKKKTAENPPCLKRTHTLTRNKTA